MQPRVRASPEPAPARDVSFKVLPIGPTKPPSFEFDSVVRFFISLISQHRILPKYIVTRENNEIIFTFPNSIEKSGKITFTRLSPYDVQSSEVIVGEIVRSSNLPATFMCALIVLLDNHFGDMYIVSTDDDIPGFRANPKTPFDIMVARAFESNPPE